MQPNCGHTTGLDFGFWEVEFMEVGPTFCFEKRKFKLGFLYNKINSTQNFT